METAGLKIHGKGDVSARAVNLVLGVWLFISAFLWPHGTASATNTWIVGLLIAIAGLIALRMPWLRWIDTALAVWLFLSTLAMPGATRGTLWNNLIVAVLVFLTSLVPEGMFPRPHWSIRGGAPARGSGLGQ